MRRRDAARIQAPETGPQTRRGHVHFDTKSAESDHANSLFESRKALESRHDRKVPAGAPGAECVFV